MVAVPGMLYRDDMSIHKQKIGIFIDMAPTDPDIIGPGRRPITILKTGIENHSDLGSPLHSGHLKLRQLSVIAVITVLDPVLGLAMPHQRTGDLPLRTGEYGIVCVIRGRAVFDIGMNSLPPFRSDPFAMKRQNIFIVAAIERESAGLNCFMLLMQRISFARVRALLSAGRSIAASKAMIVTTISNSISVNFLAHILIFSLPKLFFIIAHPYVLKLSASLSGGHPDPEPQHSLLSLNAADGIAND